MEDRVNIVTTLMESYYRKEYESAIEELAIAEQEITRYNQGLEHAENQLRHLENEVLNRNSIILRYQDIINNLSTEVIHLKRQSLKYRHRWRHLKLQQRTSRRVPTSFATIIELSDESDTESDERSNGSDTRSSTSETRSNRS